MPAHWQWIVGIIGTLIVLRIFGGIRFVARATRSLQSTDKEGTPQAILPDVIQQLIKSGDKIGAIKELRQTTGMQLTEAHQVVSSWKEGDNNGETQWSVEVFSGDKLPPDILDLIKSGKKIEAVRRLRQEAGMGTADAKHAVESVTEAASNSADFNAPTTIRGER